MSPWSCENGVFLATECLTRWDIPNAQLANHSTDTFLAHPIRTASGHASALFSDAGTSARCAVAPFSRKDREAHILVGNLTSSTYRAEAIPSRIKIGFSGLARVAPIATDPCCPSIVCGLTVKSLIRCCVSLGTMMRSCNDHFVFPFD